MSYEDQLSPAERELEAVLRSLRPMPARLDVQAAARNASRRKGSRGLRLWQTAAAALAAAAALVLWLTLGWSGPGSDRAAHQVPLIGTQVEAIELPEQPPTLLDYRRALARSAAEFDSLLGRQAMIGATPDDQAVPVGVLTIWNPHFRSSLGEM